MNTIWEGLCDHFHSKGVLHLDILYALILDLKMTNLLVDLTTGFVYGVGMPTIGPYTFGSDHMFEFPLHFMVTL